MNNPLGVSPSKGNPGTTRGKENIFWPRWDSLFHHMCSQCYAAQHSNVPLLSLCRDSPPKSSPTFSVQPRSSVGRVTVDLIRGSWVRFPPRWKDFFFASCGSLVPFTRANAQWVIHGFISTLIYTSELILCFTICVHSATRHNSPCSLLVELLKSVLMVYHQGQLAFRSSDIWLLSYSLLYLTCSHWLAEVWEVCRLVYAWYFIWQITAEQLPEVHCPPCSLFLLVGERLSATGSDRAVCDLCNTFLCSSDDITFFYIVVACCFLYLSCEVIQKVRTVFCDSLCILPVGFAVFNLSFCFVGPCSTTIQYLLHLRSDFWRLYLHRCWAVPSISTCLPPCMFQALPHLVYQLLFGSLLPIPSPHPPLPDVV